jgi:hypothetical protein
MAFFFFSTINSVILLSNFEHPEIFKIDKKEDWKITESD